MSADAYLQRILQREAVDSGLYSPVRGVQTTIEPVIREWAGVYLSSIAPSGSFAKGTANRSGTDIDLFISLSSSTPETLTQVYDKLFARMGERGYNPKRQNVSINITVSGYSVDLVPGKRQDAWGTDHSLYRRKADSWTKTNVATHINHVRQAGRLFESRVLKLWRDQKGLDFPSFYLELTVIDALSGQHSRNAVGQRLEGVQLPQGQVCERARRRPRQHEQHHLRRSHRLRAGKDQGGGRTGAAGARLERDRQMSGWSLPQLLASLHDDIERRLATARASFGHPGTKGDASERVWLELLQTYLPLRYRAERAHVVDSNGTFSDQLDVVVFDRQYSPFIFNFQEELIVPAESVYAAFEAKQSINAGQVDYAQKKVATVRRLHRTSLPIPHAGGTYPPKPLAHILGGILTFDSDWSPPLGTPLQGALSAAPEDRLDVGCIAAHGMFALHAAGRHRSSRAGSRQRHSSWSSSPASRTTPRSR